MKVILDWNGFRKEISVKDKPTTIVYPLVGHGTLYFDFEGEIENRKRIFRHRHA